MAYTGAHDSHYSQLEVVPAEQESKPPPQPLSPPDATNHSDLQKHLSRRCWTCMRRRIVLLSLLTIIIIGAVVGGAVGGTLSRRGSKSGSEAPSTTSPPSANPIMSGTATVLASYAFPTPVTYGYPNLSIFAISEAREVVYKWRTISPNGEETWNPTENTFKGLGGAVAISQNGVCALCRATGTLDVFMIFNNDSQLYRTYLDGNNWIPWMNTGVGLDFTAGPGAASMFSGRVDLWVIAKDFQLWTVAASLEDDTTYGVGNSHGGNWSVIQPTVISRSGGYLDVFLVGPVDHALYRQYYKGDGYLPSPTSYQNLGGYCASRPAAVSWDRSRIDVFIRGGDAGLWQITYAEANDSWSSWSSISGGTPIQGEPEAVSWGPNRIDIFAGE